MRSNLTVFVGLLALVAIAQAGPSFRILQQNVTINATVPVPADNNGTNSTNNTGGSVNPYPGYTALTLSEVQNDLNATLAYQHAMNAVVQTAIAQGKVPLSVYTVNNFRGAWSRTRRNGVSYVFSADLVGKNGANFYCNVTVLQNRTSGEEGMTAYHYRGNNIRSSMFPANGYRFLTPAQVHNNTVVQGAIVYGAKTMIQWLINQKKIPAQNLNYTISDLYLAAYKRSRTGTSYRFQVQGANEAGVNIRTNYTVFYRNSNKTYSQTAYWYRVWNFSRSDIANNTNSTTNVTTPVVADNSTAAVNATEEVTANNATSGSNSTVGVPADVPAPEVNVDISPLTADNSTTTTTALINLNYTFPATGNDNGSSGNTTLPESGQNVTVIESPSPVA